MELTNTDSVFDSGAYRRSRTAYILQCMFEYFISLFVSDAFLAKLLHHIGLSDSATGILSSVISVTFLFQLVSLFLSGRLRSPKKAVTICDTLSQLLFMSMFLVPFLPLSQTGKAAAVTLLMITAYFCMYIVNPSCYKWGNSFVHPDNRGVFSANKEMVSLIGGIVFTLIAGFITDKMENAGNLRGAFLFIAVTGFVVCGCGTSCLLTMKDTKNTAPAEKTELKAILSHTLGNRAFRNALVLACLWDASRYLSLGFMGTYKINELGYSVGNVQVINVAACLIRFAVSRPLGRFADRTSYATCFSLSLIPAALGCLAGGIASPAAPWWIIIYSIMYHCSLAGTYQNSYSMVYAFTDEEYIVHGLAVNNSVRGVCGFLASLLGGKILTAVQNGGNLLAGRTVYGQQILSLLSLLVTIASFVWCKCVVEKQKMDKK